MKRDLEFDEPIAEQIIESNDCAIVVQLRPPRPETGDTGWYCPYRIKDIPGEPDHKMFGGGVDAIQAIIAALCNLGADLNYDWKDRLGLNWLDAEHLGFLDAHKLPGPHSTPEERQAIIDEFFQQQRESGTD